MKRVLLSGVTVLVAASMLAGCYSNNRVGNDALSIGNSKTDGAVATSVTVTGIQVEIDGMTTPAGCTNGQSGMAFLQGATCGSAGIGAGPLFLTDDCNESSPLPSYLVGAYFRNYDPASGIPAGTTFDLSDPNHEQFVTVNLGYQAITGPQYEYCTAPPSDLADGGTYPASSGIVTVHQFAPENNPTGDFASNVELTDVVVPSSDGGPTLRIVTAHLYFQ